MKLTKLLTGAAVAALLTGAANAQLVVTNSNTDSEAVFASQVDLSAAMYQDVLDIAFTPGGAGDEEVAINALGATDDINVTITLSGGLTFDGFLSNSDINVTGTTCALGISAGGSNGGQTVTYSSVGDTNFNPTTCAFGGGAQEFDFSIPVEIAGTGNVSVEISLASTGTVIESSSYDANGGTTAVEGFVRQLDSLVYTFTPTNVDIDLSDEYELFAGSAATATVGTLLIDDEDPAQVLFSVGTGGADDVEFDIGLVGQVASGELVVTVPNATGIESVTFRGQTEALVGNTATFALATADLAALDDAAQNIDLNANTTTPAAIGNQTISASASLTAAASTNLTLEGGSGDLGDLTREGSNTGTFAWVGDSSASTANVFRATGVPATVPTIRVTLDNSTADVDGEYVVTPAMTASNGELILTNRDIETAVGSAFGRADVSWSFEADGISVSRFMVTNGVVTQNATDLALDGNDDLVPSDN